MRGGQQTHVDGNRLVAPYSFKFALLKDPQKSYLRLGWKIADLVEKERPAVGRFKTPQTPLGRAGECALFMPEQFGGEQSRRDRRAIHADKRPRRTVRLLVNGASKQFFASSGFTQYEDSRVRRRHFSDLPQRRMYGLRRTDDLFEHRGMVDFFAQRQVFA